MTAEHQAAAAGPARAPYDVLTIGRVGVDLYPLEAEVALEHVTRFGRFLGGSATNVAVAAARHGRRTAVITRTGDDPFGRFVHAALCDLGVDDAFVTAVPGLPTPVTFCEIFPPDHFPLYFYRYPKAPDLEIRGGELDLAACRDARIFWATVTGLYQQLSRDAHHVAWAARAAARSPRLTWTTGRCSGRAGRPRGPRSRPRCRRSRSRSGTSTRCSPAPASPTRSGPGGCCWRPGSSWP